MADNAPNAIKHMPDWTWCKICGRKHHRRQECDFVQFERHGMVHYMHRETHNAIKEKKNG